MKSSQKILSSKLLLLTVLASGSLFICLRIELLNYRAGGMLPRKLPAEGNPKWRTPFRVSEKMWRKVRSKGRQDESLLTRELTSEEQKEMESTVQKARAENNLYSFVSSWGLLQYPLALFIAISGVLGGFLYKTRLEKSVSFLNSLVGFSCLAFALIRAYFTSLGW